MLDILIDNSFNALAQSSRISCSLVYFAIDSPAATDFRILIPFSSSVLSPARTHIAHAAVEEISITFPHINRNRQSANRLQLDILEKLTCNASCACRSCCSCCTCSARRKLNLQFQLTMSPPPHLTYFPCHLCAH